MRNLLFFLSINFLGVIAFGQTAFEYMSSIDVHHLEISKRSWDYTSTIAHSKNGKKIDQTRQDLISAIRNAKREVSRLKDYKGETAYRDSVVSYLNLTEIVLTQNYDKILDMEEIAEQSYDLMEAYLLAQSEAGKMLDAGTEMLNAEQKKFADKYNIKIVEDETKLGKKLAKAGEVYDYYNPIYLIFFKSYKQEAYLNGAIAKNDINAIEQNRKSLISISEEGLTKVGEMDPFYNDNKLKESCMEMLRYYIKEGKNEAKTISNFYLKKETFEKFQVAFEKIKNKDRTQEDVDKINKAGEEYNKAVTEYNIVIEVSNKERKKVLNQWNNAVSKFLKTHIGH